MSASASRFQCPNPRADIAENARSHQNRLTKPPGSLGRLEDVAIHMAAWQGDRFPAARPAAALLFAADHPVTRHSVSPYPAAVTAAMLRNFVAGGAAASVLCRLHQVPLTIIDVGVNGDVEPELTSGAVRWQRSSVAREPAGDICVEDAMTEDVFDATLRVGRQAVAELDPDLKLLILGDMGIGNTTVASSVSAGILGGAPEDYVGAGTGASGEMLERKRCVVRTAVERLGTDREPFEVLRRVGGKELVAMLGAMMAALERRVVVLVDGFVVTATALALCTREPRARSGLLWAHCSAEAGHRRVLEQVGGVTLLDLGLRLGEGSGALSAFPLVEGACELHRRMATFESASVPDAG